MTKRTYLYPGDDGAVLFKVTRTDNADGTKKFTQWRRASVDAEWEAKSPEGLRPIYGLADVLFAEDGAAVLVVEGEKVCEAAREIFGDKLIVVTWAGGSNAVKRTDWAPLKRHRVAIMPDLDQKNFPDDHASAGQVMPFMMQPGTKAALQVATLTGGALVNVPDEFIAAAVWVKESGWDLADEIPEPFTLADIQGWIRDALRAAGDALAVAIEAPAVATAAPSPATTDHGEILPADHNGMNGENVPTAVVGVPQLIMNGNGGVKPCFENAVRMLTHYDRFKLRFDLFANRPCIGDGPLEDEHIALISRWVQTEGVVVSTNVVGEAVIAAAMERRFHPVQDYLDDLRWDGVARIDDWLIDHAGAAATDFNRAISAKWLIQAVARIAQPGCQADAMLILEGPQGFRKSTMLRALFGAKWFSDHLPDLSNKDALLQLLGMWCIEVAELSTFNRSDASKIKSFITSPVDRYRAPYGRIAKDYPRSCVFAGTVNPGAAGYLKDPTGGRRFWPIEVGNEIDTDAVAANRDQYWAEAYSRYRAGEAWWLADAHLRGAAEDAQDDRREDDVWEDKIAHHLIGKTRVTIADILENALGLYKAGEWTTADHMRIGRILTAMKWDRRRLRIGTKRSWMYTSPEARSLSAAALDNTSSGTSGDSGDMFDEQN